MEQISARPPVQPGIWVAEWLLSGCLANRRLYRRWAAFDARGKRSTVSAVAVARELAGWCWSLATMEA